MASTPAQAPRGLSRRSAARKGPAKSLHRPRARGRWRERPGPFRRLLDVPLPGALPAGRPEASALASGGRRPEEGKAIMSHFSVLVLTGEGQDVEGLLLPYMENCCGEPPREYMEFFEDEECELNEETGRRGYWQNPNARWDWYEVGGRFRGMLRASRGSRAVPERLGGRYPKGRYDSARVGDCDFGPDEACPRRRGGVLGAGGRGRGRRGAAHPPLPGVLPAQVRRRRHVRRARVGDQHMGGRDAGRRVVRAGRDGLVGPELRDRRGGPRLAARLQGGGSSMLASGDISRSTVGLN